jgi:tetratricopeptide (TPR) repeat protein
VKPPRAVLLLLVLLLGFGAQQCSKTKINGTPADAETAVLFDGMGSLHHPIRTTNQEAQKFFDQGLTFVYAFNFDEAVHSFKRAAQLDPNAAMPFWGIALSLGPNYNSTITGPNREKTAFDAIQKASQLSATGPEGEKGYVEALSRRFSDDSKSDVSSLAREYSAAMGAFSKRFPDDPDAAALYAESLMDLHPWQLWTNDGEPAEGTPEVLYTLGEVLRRWPEHIGANHFYIHAMEASPYPERALPSAHRLETLVPFAGHLVHMPSHIYMRTGDYALAVKSNADAVEADRKYIRERAISNIAYVLGYAEHNLRFLADAANMDGEFDVAHKAAEDLASEARAALADKPHAEEFLVTPILVSLRYSRWDDVLKIPKPDASLKGMTFFWHYARGCASAAKGSSQDAETDRIAMEQAYRQIPQGRAFGMLFNTWSTLHDLATHTLNARIAGAQGDTATAIGEWRAAVAVQDQMRYNEPSDWYYPVRESLGAALLRAGKPTEAEDVFREDLSRNPRNPRSLFGLLKSLQVQNNAVDAEWVQRALEAAWKGGKNQLQIENF